MTKSYKNPLLGSIALLLLMLVMWVGFGVWYEFSLIELEHKLDDIHNELHESLHNEKP